MKKLNIYFASYYLHYSFHCIPRISFNRGNNPKYIYNQNISITRRENNTKWIKSPSSRLFQPLHKILGTSYMTNRLISGVGLLRRPFIRLSALDCPICSFCPQRAANSTNSITPVSRVLDRRPCSPSRRELSPPRRLWGGARSAARRGWWWGVAATPTRVASVSRTSCVTLRRTGSSMRASHVAAHERANWPRGPTLGNCDWVLYIKRGKGSAVFSLNDLLLQANRSICFDLFNFDLLKLRLKNCVNETLLIYRILTKIFRLIFRLCSTCGRTKVDRIG